MNKGRIALIIPCHNEALTIAQVIEGFRSEIPSLQIYICDNGSTDDTANISTQHGAHLLFEPCKGKGNALRKLLKEVEADYYVMADGDATHNPAIISQMLEQLTEKKADVVLSVRQRSSIMHAPIRTFGGVLFNAYTNLILGSSFSDSLCGYRAFTKEVAQNFKCLSTGFEVEAEFNAYISAYHINYIEIITHYKDRSVTGNSKLRVFHDGLRIAFALVFFSLLYKREKKKQ